MKFIGPSSTELLQFLTEYVTRDLVTLTSWPRCHVTWCHLCGLLDTDLLGDRAFNAAGL